MRRAVKKVLKSDIIDQNIKPKVIYELGCGWGPLVIDAAKTFPDAAVKGIEFSYLGAKFSKIRAKLQGLKNVEILRKDFFRHDLGDADVIVLYMLEYILGKLSPKFIEELKPGTIIVSNTFVIPDWAPVKVHEIVKKPIPLNIYVYKVPESLPKP
jgi:predicted RNA methylase